MKAQRSSELRVEACIIDKAPLSQWIVSEDRGHIRESTVCKECSSIYVSVTDTNTGVTKNYIHELGAISWRCVEHGAELLRVKIPKADRSFFNTILRQPEHREVLRCPSCGPHTNDRLMPLRLDLSA